MRTYDGKESIDLRAGFELAAVRPNMGDLSGFERGVRVLLLNELRQASEQFRYF